MAIDVTDEYVKWEIGRYLGGYNTREGVIRDDRNHIRNAIYREMIDSIWLYGEIGDSRMVGIVYKIWR